MDISVVILTWNSEKTIYRCIKSLVADLQNSNRSYEVFAVDNGSVDKTVPILEKLKNEDPQHINTIFLKRNRGTTYSRNIALKMARGKHICFLDSDVELSIGTILQLINTLESDSRTGLVAPKLLYPNGSLQKSTDVFPTILTKIFRFFFLKFTEKRQNIKEQKNEIMEVDYAISAVWMLKNELLTNVGLLDENIFYAPEDVDYCLRIWRAGYRVVYDSRVSAVHHAQEKSRGMKINTFTISHINGLIYYFRKHQYFFKPPQKK
jgi:GT2 family glycosyltransferase